MSELFDQVADEIITDADYLVAVTHKLWPVSYIDDDGEQVNALYSFCPGRAFPDYFIGEPINVTTRHPINMPDLARDHKIAELQAKIDALKAPKPTLTTGGES